jgi:hypothetical protein
MRVWLRLSDAQLGVAVDFFFCGWIFWGERKGITANPADFIDLGEL